MDTKLIFLTIGGAYVVYYAVQIAREYLAHKQPKRNKVEANVINLQTQKTGEDVESADPVTSSGSVKSKRSFFRKKEAPLSPKSQPGLQIENITGIHLIEDNELVGPDSDLDTMPIEEYLKIIGA